MLQKTGSTSADTDNVFTDTPIVCAKDTCLVAAPAVPTEGDIDCKAAVVAVASANTPPRPPL